MSRKETEYPAIRLVGETDFDIQEKCERYKEASYRKLRETRLTRLGNNRIKKV